MKKLNVLVLSSLCIGLLGATMGAYAKFPDKFPLKLIKFGDVPDNVLNVKVVYNNGEEQEIKQKAFLDTTALLDEGGNDGVHYIKIRCLSKNCRLDPGKNCKSNDAYALVRARKHGFFSRSRANALYFYPSKDQKSLTIGYVGYRIDSNGKPKVLLAQCSKRGVFG